MRSRGVMEKCTYCVQRLNAARIDARLGGRDARATATPQTACQQACPAEAIHFGDLARPREPGRARRAAATGPTRILGELNTRPRTTYQARLRNPHPGLAGAARPGGTDHA